MRADLTALAVILAMLAAVGGAYLLVSATRGMRQARRLHDRERVLCALDRVAWTYGLDLARAVGMRAGRLSPVLDRLEQADLIEARWEPADGPGPRRRMYRRTTWAA